ncbi:hypothetical protein [Methanolobus sp. WCC5]|uniref:hypothetical protein n=1 Tax=Methanolobus sp. WCC5 TaxID=3125785 RepID=UPI0032459CDE
MATFKPKDIESALSKKGFHAKPDGHHRLYVYYLEDGKIAARIFVSHGKKEYGSILLNRMKNQLHLSKEQFNDLLKCPLTKEKLQGIYETNK